MRTADEPGQTLNADLCFVPATQAAPTPLPAVSGSSGRLVVAAPPTEHPAAHPGQVFADPELPYHEAMQAFVATSPPRTTLPSPSTAAIAPDPAAVQRALRQEALRQLLPPELQFLITDRGTHFTANAFAQLATDADFVHVLIARHRPQSNGIAERFVQTLKDWLADQTWPSADELVGLLAAFLVEYNNRPHRGLGLPGLSPNEFANRIWVL